VGSGTADTRFEGLQDGLRQAIKWDRRDFLLDDAAACCRQSDIQPFRSARS
jgi:hypothetical protein